MIPQLLMRAGGAIGSNSLLNIGWSTQMLNQMVSGILPEASNTVTVRVYGSRESYKTDLLGLALSVASGTIGRFSSKSDSVIMLKIDHVNRIVECILSYAGGGTFSKLNILDDGINMMRNGISEQVVAGYMPPSIAVVPAEKILDTDGASITSNLMLDGGIETQLITGPPIAQNPQPMFDGVSRNTDLTALITAALSPPCCDLPENFVEDYPKITDAKATYGSTHGALLNYTAGKLSTK